MGQDFTNEDLELADQAHTLLALLCKDEACAHVRSAEEGNGYQAWQALCEHGPECDKPLEPVAGSHAL